MLITLLKLTLAILSVVMLVSTLLAPSADRSLEGVFTGQTKAPTKKQLSIRITWIVFTLWLLDAIVIALLKG